MNPVSTFVLEWLRITPDTLFGVHQGVVVAGIFLLGILLIRFFPRLRWQLAALIIVAITPLATLGFWFSTGQLGISDWDYYFSLHHSYRETILTYHQLPHWNPYICGGTAALADPEFRFFTPTFLVELAFGIENGFPLAIWLATAVGGVGMLLLGKRLGLSVYSSLVASMVATFGSVTLLEIVEGHPNVFAAMFIPWIFWAWLAAYREKSTKWNIITGIFLAFTFFQGGIYLLMYTALAFLILPFFTSRKKDAWVVNIHSGLWALGLAAVKLIPVLLWLSQFQDQMYAGSTSTLGSLHKIFLGRYLHGVENVIPNQGSGWHEYGAYIGPVAAVLACIGVIFNWRRRVVVGLGMSTILAILLSSTGPTLKPFFDQASWFPRSNISRVVLFAVIPISLLSGFGMESLIKNKKKAATRGISYVILALIALDLFTMSYPLSEQAFVLPRSLESLPPAKEPLQHSPFAYKTRHNEVDYSRAYTDILQGYGSMNYCSVLTPSPAVRVVTDEIGNGTAYIENEQTHERGTYTIEEWSPNRVVLKVETPPDTPVILNTNYASGWQVNGQPAQNISNRVGWIVEVGGTHRLIFQYRSPGFLLGVSISLLTVGVGTLSLLRARGRQTQPHQP
ncbi:MAG: hypothetical protein HYR90_03000 [Candidatus Andersenbacteria bacterium]|nr:hypothetical protein [Candidatus Andersenbacteria bacterium]MBI3250231.1 hypothetical protein [Candidatus Andersenbacteria bacterium]